MEYADFVCLALMGTWGYALGHRRGYLRGGKQHVCVEVANTAETFIPTCPDNCVEVGGIVLGQPAILFLEKGETGIYGGCRWPKDDEESRRAALSAHLNCPLDDVETSRYCDQAFRAGSEEWLVCTDDEADGREYDSLGFVLFRTN